MQATTTAAPIWYTSDQVAQAVGPNEARELIVTALRSGFDPAADPDRAAKPVGTGELLLMPSTIGKWSGIKVASVAPLNPAAGLPRIQATYVLMDSQTLSTQALLEGGKLTELRTPAMSAVAADRLAPSGPCTLLVFGTGPQAWGHIEAMSRIRPLSEVLISGRTPSRVESLVERTATLGLRARAANSNDVANAQIIVCATSASEPLFDGSEVQDGACVIAMGSHEPAVRELDGALMGRSTVFVEDQATALREAGDVILAISEGTLADDQLVPVRELVNDLVTRSTDRPNVFKGTGMSWQDLVVATGVHEHYTA